MQKYIKLTAYSLIGLIASLIFTNPTTFEFEEKLKTESEFNTFFLSKYNCLVYGRKSNFIIFSIYEVTNYCEIGPDPRRTNYLYDESISKQYLAFLKTFKPIN